MAYTFYDDATPSVPTTILPASGELDFVNGSPQLDLFSAAYGGSTVTVTIVPPSGWTLTSVVWSSGNGTYRIPAAGVEDTYTFDVTVTQGAVSKTKGGTFKIKKAGSI
jgi:hypothetical protein